MYWCNKCYTFAFVQCINLNEYNQVVQQKSYLRILFEQNITSIAIKLSLQLPCNCFIYQKASVII